jgi:hypothetical protein
MVRRLRLELVLLLLPGLFSYGQDASQKNGQRVLSVGPGKPFATPSQAAAVVKDGDIVEISGGDYSADVAVWRASNTTIRGVGSRPHLKADGANAQGKAIWVIQGDNTLIENIEFSGAKVPDGNGAAIRQEGRRLTLRGCYIHDNEMGILAGNKDSDVLIEASELSGSRGPYNHNIYMGNIHSFTLQFSYVHHAIEGHNVKTRAQKNFILYNRIMDEQTGRSSYAIDIPNGGRSYVVGNLIQKGPRAENSSVIAYAAEGATNDVQELYLVNNTMVSNFGRGLFLNVFGKPSTVVLNNIFSGAGVVPPSFSAVTPNLISANPLFQDPLRFDYRLKRGSPAIDAGMTPGAAAGFALTPQFEYVHPMGHQTRSLKSRMDIGAFEYVD